MNIYLTNKDIWNLTEAILAIVGGIYLIFHQQEVANYFIAMLGL